ncbi:hypothetical protein Hypma_006499 [Hypsizygus marmoreus]|uniref:Uncharacterized protein n=1 Tax=Hypsizygus marmoreus TaxID=39966 RepID=A0A369JWB1_HYPMA|nr:hypothetical protein Hypma_006499 [Hypsizygus marmoreus]
MVSFEYAELPSNKPRVVDVLPTLLQKDDMKDILLLVVDDVCFNIPLLQRRGTLLFEGLTSKIRTHLQYSGSESLPPGPQKLPTVCFNLEDFANRAQ